MLLTKKLDSVKCLLEAKKRLFWRQGAVVATYREADGRRLGPYFSLRYREEGRQRSCYLGRCQELAAKVRELLSRLQAPRRKSLELGRIRRLVGASLTKVRKSFHRDFEEFNQAHGGHLYLHGREVRGWRQLYARLGELRAEMGTMRRPGSRGAPTRGAFDG